MTTPSTDKNLPARNTLNVRLMRSKSVTRKLGDGYEKETAAIETDLPFGVDALQGLEQIADTLETHLSKGQTGQSPSHSSEQKTSSTTSVGSPPQSLSVEALEKLEWRLYKSGHRASWIFADKAPRALLETLAKGGVELGQFHYKFSGPSESPKLFVSRTPLKD